MKKKIIGLVNFMVLFPLVFTNQVMAYVDEPIRLREAESYVVNGVIAIWALSIPYFMYIVGRIGFEKMLSAGDEQKNAALKTRGGNFFLSFGMVFGGYIFVRLLISLLGLTSPASCFTSPMGDTAIFQFFFPTACN